MLKVMEKDVEPIRGVQDLWNWKAAESVKAIPIENYSYNKLEHGEREVLLCHDMKGGFLLEERESGCEVDPTCAPYVFLNWWNIDIFCYFAHSFVTTPPRPYVRLAHKHGCLILGTVITEWNDGRKLCDEFLASDESIDRTITALLNISRAHSLDGWLINIENRLDAAQVLAMVKFVQRLTKEMQKVTRSSRVIWYDSVTKNGDLRWQNQLNDLNKLFYDACDGIFLNYNWTTGCLLNSADHGLLNRIYIGIDVFARGCVGGWDSHKSFALANFLKMSVAVFAPGWIVECHPLEDSVTNGLRFWSKLSRHVPRRQLTSLPTNVTFSCGFTKDAKWFALDDISLQPQFHDFMIPCKDGGIRFPVAGTYELFTVDRVQCKQSMQITIEALSALVISINGVEYETEVDGDKYSCRLPAKLQVQSIAVTTRVPNCQVMSLNCSRL